MKKRKWTQILLLATMMMGVLSGCEKKSDLPDLSSLEDVFVISREEGSGTRDEFEMLVGTLEKGMDLTATSTQEMEKMVSEHVNGIGYMAYSSLQEDAKIKPLQIDGCEASRETIEKETYALCRDYYFAYVGEPTEAERDFMNYVTTAGQELVGDFATPVKKTATFLSNQSAGVIRIEGSSSTATIVEALKEDYKKYNDQVKIEIVTTDSSRGLTSVMSGACDMAMISRDLKEYEEEIFEKSAFASDAIVVVVNGVNPIESLTLSQIQTLFDGTCPYWKELK